MSKVSTAGSGAKDPEVKGLAVSVSIGPHLIGTISLGAVGSRAVFHRSSVAGLIAQLVRLFILSSPGWQFFETVATRWETPQVPLSYSSGIIHT